MTTSDIEETRLHQQAQLIVDQTPALLAMIEGKIKQIDHPWRYRIRKWWTALKGNGRHIKEQFRSKPPRIPRLVAYQTRGQLPMTLLALIVIATVCFIVWISVGE